MVVAIKVLSLTPLLPNGPLSILSILPSFLPFFFSCGNSTVISTASSGLIPFQLGQFIILSSLALRSLFTYSDCSPALPLVSSWLRTAVFYSGMCLKGLASFSWQKGSLPTVQISVSW